MWFDILIYSFTAIVTSTAHFFAKKYLKPQTFWQDVGVAMIGVLCGLCAFIFMLNVWVIVTLIQIVGG